jgi:GTP pyrophosphokinase
MYNVLEQIHKLFKPLNQVSDYIASPKSNGYQSIHTKVRTEDGYVYEFLIRSRLMDEMAEYGLIHLIYNMDTDTNSALKTYVSSIKDLYNDSYSNRSNHGETLDNIKSNLVTDQVFIYTPTNEVYELPKGSSVLDFAYKVHSELGNHCIASTVNGKTRPISFKLRNHDVVQVMTSDTQLPKEDWLDFIISSKASKQIKLALKKKYELTEKERKSFISKLYLFKKNKSRTKLAKSVRNIEILTKFYSGLISRIDKEIKMIDKLISMDLKIENDTVITLIKAEFIDQKSFDKFMRRINSMKFVINVFEFK